MQGAPKYKKLELHWADDSMTSYEDCGMVITSDKILVILEEILTFEDGTMEKSSTGTIFNLSDLKEYVTFKDHEEPIPYTYPEPE